MVRQGLDGDLNAFFSIRRCDNGIEKICTYPGPDSSAAPTYDATIACNYKQGLLNSLNIDNCSEGGQKIKAQPPLHKRCEG